MPLIVAQGGEAVLEIEISRFVVDGEDFNSSHADLFRDVLGATQRIAVCGKESGGR
jgi:hypothetical protein